MSSNFDEIEVEINSEGKIEFPVDCVEAPLGKQDLEYILGEAPDVINGSEVKAIEGNSRKNLDEIDDVEYFRGFSIETEENLYINVAHPEEVYGKIMRGDGNIFQDSGFEITVEYDGRFDGDVPIIDLKDIGESLLVASGLGNLFEREAVKGNYPIDREEYDEDLETKLDYLRRRALEIDENGYSDDPTLGIDDIYPVKDVLEQS